MPCSSSFYNYFATTPYLLFLNNVLTSSVNNRELYFLWCYYFQMPDICVKIPNPFYITLNNKRMSERWQILFYPCTQALFTILPCIAESGKPYFVFRDCITR